MCKDATIITRVKNVEKPPEETKIQINNGQSKILCNVIVRATHDLYIKQDKNQNEIQIFLKNDCGQLSNSELSEQVILKIYLIKSLTIILSVQTISGSSWK